MQRVLGREKKKESLLAGMGHKEVASENVDKSSKCWCQQSRKLNKAVSAVFAENLCASLHMLFELITKKKPYFAWTIQPGLTTKIIKLLKIVLFQEITTEF